MKKPSAGRPSKKPPDRLTLFFDENFGRKKIKELLQGVDARVEVHADHFETGTEDAEWIPEVTKRGWIILSFDRRIRYKANERAAIREHRARVFFLTAAETTAEQAAQIVRAAIPRIEKLVQETHAPFYATINKNGEIGVVKSGDEI